MTDMDRAYKFRLYPNDEQAKRLDYILMLCRMVYNAGLEQRRLAYHLQYKIRYRDQQSELPPLKDELETYKQVHSQVLQTTLQRLDKAYDNFFRRVALRKQGHRIKVGFPRFKSEQRFRSITYPQSGFEILPDGHLELSKIGTIRMFKHREVEGQIKTLTIKKDGIGDWYAIFTAELPDVPQREIKTKMGVDVGLESLITTSEGEKIEPPKFLRKSEERIKHYQREVSRKVKGSNNRKKAIRRLAKVHRKVERQRDDFLHKTSRYLSKKADLIVFEDLQIQNMMRNHCLAKSIADASWGKLIRFTAYKVLETGGQEINVDPYGTSQECSRCGAMTRISLSERIHVCQCGFSIDRDWNASICIERRVGSDRPEPVPTPVEMLPLPLPLGGGK
ncbi:MAG: transposase [Candidatus Aenigmarchaeota archaeon]|nr:transposase [Candidatus Aenigmarchaeota archaeon]